MSKQNRQNAVMRHCIQQARALRLAELGFQVKRLAGGITTWHAAGFPVVGTRAQALTLGA